MGYPLALRHRKNPPGQLEVLLLVEDIPHICHELQTKRHDTSDYEEALAEIDGLMKHA